MDLLGRCQPVYEEFEGWKQDILKARSIKELHANARKYLQRLEELAGVNIVLVSVGAGREETIIMENPFHN